MIKWKQGNQVGFDLTFEIEGEDGNKSQATLEVVGTLVQINPKVGTITVQYAHPGTFEQKQLDITTDVSEFREGTLF